MSADGDFMRQARALVGGLADLWMDDEPAFWERAETSRPDVIEALRESERERVRRNWA